MQINLDARVRTSDGHDAGKLRRVLVDPATLRITGFVVSTGGLLGREVIVGEHDFVEGREGELMLRLSKAELAQQPTFDEAGFTAPPAGLASTMGYGFASNAYLVPVVAGDEPVTEDRKSTRLNSSHGYTSYAVFCLKKKNTFQTNSFTKKKKKQPPTQQSKKPTH